MSKQSTFPMPQVMSALGDKSGQLCKARRTTLKHLSRSAGISLSHASAIERGVSSPSVDALNAVAQTLDVTQDWFTAHRSGASLKERACVVRAQKRRNLNAINRQDAGELGYSDQRLSGFTGGDYYMDLAVYAPFSERPEQSLQENSSEERGLVLKGELEMQMGDERITLRTGDSYRFDARLPRHGHNQTDRICCSVWGVSPMVIPKDVTHSEGLAGEGCA
ncbi:MAG: helix-turn-helix domain-containing protein [Roseobacter sp.]